MLSLRTEPLDGPVGRALVAALGAEVEDRYRDDDDPLDEDESDRLDVTPDQVAPPHGTFLVARLDGEPVGCGALRRHSEGRAEIKRMYVVPTARHQGVGRALLAALEVEAARLGYQQMTLETGLRQPEAMAMYEAAGWRPTEPYGPYRLSPVSRCYTKDVTSQRTDSSRSTGSAVVQGVVAGLAGTAAMTVTEKLEQAVTGRPNSYVPAHTLERLLRLPVRPDADRQVLNHVMHWGTGAVVGALRGVMASAGLQGPLASALHTAVRFTTDQTLENATGVGSPPPTWPRSEAIIDVGHKAIYGMVTGAVADRLARRRSS